MPFPQRMKIVGYVLLGLLVIGAIGAVVNPPKPGEGLTPEQRLEIFDYCNQHPKALRCQ